MNNAFLNQVNLFGQLTSLCCDENHIQGKLKICIPQPKLSKGFTGQEEIDRTGYEFNTVIIQFKHNHLVQDMKVFDIVSLSGEIKTIMQPVLCPKCKCLTMEPTEIIMVSAAKQVLSVPMSDKEMLFHNRMKNRLLFTGNIIKKPYGAKKNRVGVKILEPNNQSGSIIHMVCYAEDNINSLLNSSRTVLVRGYPKYRNVKSGAYCEVTKKHFHKESGTLQIIANSINQP